MRAVLKESNRISGELARHDKEWARSKTKLRTDAAFLKRWLELLILSETYAYKHETAKKNMLQTLLARVSPHP